jgi:chromatin remodeling complex protein RSC6
MPRKQNKQVEDEVSEDEVSEEEVSEEEEETPKKTKKKVEVKEPKKKVTVSTKKNTPKTTRKTEVKSTEEKPVRKSRTINKDDINVMFEELLTRIDKEIENARENTTKVKGTGVQSLRSIRKSVKNLQNANNRVMKQKQKTPRKNNNSGFLKPVLLSKEMAGFMGWDRKNPTSRVDVTRFLCKYISDNELQNPKDRREIVADDKLAKLLNYDPKKDIPLNYYRLQSYMKPHFEKIEEKPVKKV